MGGNGNIFREGVFGKQGYECLSASGQVMQLEIGGQPAVVERVAQAPGQVQPQIADATEPEAFDAEVIEVAGDPAVDDPGIAGVAKNGLRTQHGGEDEQVFQLDAA